MKAKCRLEVTAMTTALLSVCRYSDAFSVAPATNLFSGPHHVGERAALSVWCEFHRRHHDGYGPRSKRLLKYPENDDRQRCGISKVLLSANDNDLNAETTRRLVSRLETENELLKQTVAALENDKKRLQRRRRELVIIESFEGRKNVDEFGDEIDPWWNDDDSSDTDSEDIDVDAIDADLSPSDRNTFIHDNADLTDTSRATRTTLFRNKRTQQQRERQTQQQQALLLDNTSCKDGKYDQQLSCPTEPDVSFNSALKTRAYWLCGLLALQSLSGFVLAKNQKLLHSHPVIVYFLTMLVGAGGNAGNQASVRVIRGLALGTLNERTQRQFLNREFKMAISLSLILSFTGFVRASIFKTPLAETIAITLALVIIVFTSICFGAVLPILLKHLGVDPAHSSTSIQVIMDILGVLLTVFVSTFILDSTFGKALVTKVSFVGGK